MLRPGFDGLLVIDKPSGITSREVVNRAQRWFPLRTRIGHSGTLDPLATGVLVLCIGSATRLTEYIQQMPKVYAAGITLGASSDTDDADGKVTPNPEATMPTPNEIRTALDSFLGAIEQIPPTYSAAKVTGRRAYDLARKGHDVVLQARTVTIHGIDIARLVYPDLNIVIRCSKGTYIRSLARDLGGRLGSGGYVSALRRTQVGCFHEKDAITLESTPLAARRRLLPLALAVSDLPRVTLDEVEASRLLHGQRISSPIAWASPQIAVFDDAERLLAVADVEGDLLHANKVLVGTDSM